MKKCRKCGHVGDPHIQLHNDEDGSRCWQCGQCAQYNFEGPLISLDEVRFQFGSSFECPGCPAQNFIPCEDPLHMSQVVVTCHNCMRKFEINADVGTIRELKEDPDASSRQNTTPS